jgi:4-hydroxybenzoate polyprenyltransferase
MYFQVKDVKDEEDDVIGVGIARGMLDHSRMALCIFMLAVVTFNPFGVVLNRYVDQNKDYSDAVIEGRTLQYLDSKF